MRLPRAPSYARPCGTSHEPRVPAKMAKTRGDDVKPNKQLVLTAMVFAVAMTFIDQTIVAIAIPNIQHNLSLSGTGAQWVINGYLLSLSALFAFGGKLADVFGRRRILVIGVIGFAITSALCGLTPTTGIGETWIIVCRVLQ